MFAIQPLPASSASSAALDPDVGRFLSGIAGRFCVYAEAFKQVFCSFNIEAHEGWEDRYGAVPTAEANYDQLTNIPPSAILPTRATLCWDSHYGLVVQFSGRAKRVPLARCIDAWDGQLPVLRNRDLMLVTSGCLCVPICLLDRAALLDRSIFEVADIARAITDKLAASSRPRAPVVNLNLPN
ncbi:hypothetical protein L1F30_11505 [Simiduia sp. 21SJ11W-1]|uniref:hypothetical protein n=1 Tax=Simiduia sp. 21SJ11W-1 TaxID=2909669 RepID=UPI0020A19756|nr:hypothetical protein [Simiduia sp. 21SJ11W-1]UTA46785.1 hypothetical protein L1F30_11505 [Simiduia sp. 21SJ11W-1]